MGDFRIPPLVSELIEFLNRLPGIGNKTAQRLAFFILDMEEEEVVRMAEAMVQAKRRLITCDRCHLVDDRNPCFLCLDKSRDSKTICVVQEVRDVWAMERTQAYRGLYHVLHGALSPIEGIGPEHLSIAALLDRVKEGGTGEVILATNSTVEGEATLLYLAKLLSASPVRVTRIAHGLPAGGDLEYADEMTLTRALEGRRLLDGTGV
ncbi:recombination mediator RecR [Pasteuria penetrans]|uniref:recombination mediator RecR n=1 Tax=Pasteuria penetrans TaxID=86005 RepID=UPI000FC229E6|nr:recombination mediator RecR [Pasteuria penetrans]